MQVGQYHSLLPLDDPAPRANRARPTLGVPTSLFKAISQSDGEAYAKSIGASFFSASAKAGKGVEQVFASVAKALDAKRGASTSGAKGVGRSRSLKIAREEETKPKSGDCC